MTIADTAAIIEHPFADNSEDEHGPYWDPWDAMGVSNGGYSSEVDQHAIAILRAIRDGDRSGRFVTDIAQATGLAPAHVELWQYLFCSADWLDYGSSPRGAFPRYGFDFDGLIAAWEAYYERRWVETGDALG